MISYLVIAVVLTTRKILRARSTSLNIAMFMLLRLLSVPKLLKTCTNISAALKSASPLFVAKFLLTRLLWKCMPKNTPIYKMKLRKLKLTTKPTRL